MTGTGIGADSGQQAKRLHAGGRIKTRIRYREEKFRIICLCMKHRSNAEFMRMMFPAHYEQNGMLKILSAKPWHTINKLLNII